MSDREADLLERWRTERATYKAWGDWVRDKIHLAIRGRLGINDEEIFLRIPTKVRTKDGPSLVQKAFHRKKPYTDPYHEIEDKVGIRLVVLLSSEVRIVEDVIKQSGLGWTSTKSRDFEDERSARPYEFDYQSLHYVVRSTLQLEPEGFADMRDIPCEVQIRTLLQHAYSELTHETIYKPKVAAKAHVKRSAAKSMALIEATDDYFQIVREDIDKELALDKSFGAMLEATYKEHIGLEPEAGPLNEILLDHYLPLIGDVAASSVVAWLLGRHFIFSRIKTRAALSSAFRVGAVLLVYYAVHTRRSSASVDSPLDDETLGIVYTDLGLAMDGAG